MLPLQTKVTDISGLQSALGFWEYLDYVATGIVFLGVLGEFLAEFTNIFRTASETQEAKRRKTKLTKVSTLILLLGLVGEISAVVRTSTLTGNITQALRGDILAAYLNANDAIIKGSQANLRANQLEGENVKLRMELERETSTRLAFERQVLSAVHDYLTPRILTSRQRAALRNYLLQHQPHGSVTIKYLTNSPEAEAYAFQLGDAFKQAGWGAFVNGDTSPRLEPPRFVGAACEEDMPQPYKRSASQWDALQTVCGALAAAGVSTWEVNNLDTFSKTYSMYVYVGARPLRLPPASPQRGEKRNAYRLGALKVRVVPFTSTVATVR